MRNVTIAVDIAKNVFEIAVSAAAGHIRERRRMSRQQFEWALEREGEGHTNRAAVALANKLARIAWAVWKHERRFDGDHALQLAAAA